MLTPKLTLSLGLKPLETNTLKPRKSYPKPEAQYSWLRLRSNWVFSSPYCDPNLPQANDNVLRGVSKTSLPQCC